MRDGFKKVIVTCDRYPSFASLINRIPLFPPRMKKEKKKPTQIQPTFTINIAEAAKAHYFYHEFFFENRKTRHIPLSSAYTLGRRRDSLVSYQSVTKYDLRLLHEEKTGYMSPCQKQKIIIPGSVGEYQNTFIDRNSRQIPSNGRPSLEHN